MDATSSTTGALSRALELLPATEEDILLTGIVSKIIARITELKKAEKRLIELYESLETLDRAIKANGVTPDNHTSYNDLLEWRAIRYELEELTRLLESL
jgi:hypothetical protein